MFGTKGNEALSLEAAQDKFAELARQTGRSTEAIAEGFINIAVQQMANAIKKISVARGYDVTRYTLQCFGGAGGQHACLVADALGMTRVFVHPLAGVLSAYGMGLADQNVIREQSVEAPLTRGHARDRAAARRARRPAQAELRKQQLNAGDVTVRGAFMCATRAAIRRWSCPMRRVATSAPSPASSRPRTGSASRS